MTQRLPRLLLIAYLALFALLARQPYDRAVWFAENLPIVLIVAALVLTRRRFSFSNTAYLMLAFLIFLHTIGGHYTFERVPFDWVTDLFGFSRNHYDRMAHFTVGFYAYPMAWAPSPPCSSSLGFTGALSSGSSPLGRDGAPARAKNPTPLTEGSGFHTGVFFRSFCRR